MKDHLLDQLQCRDKLRVSIHLQLLYVCVSHTFRNGKLFMMGVRSKDTSGARYGGFLAFS